MIKYESNPKKIRKKSLQHIHEQVSLDHLSENEQQIALRLLLACGDLSLVDNLRISEGAVEAGLEIQEDNYEILCDTEIVIGALQQKSLQHEPVCLINKAGVISQAKADKATRSMLAVEQWKNYLPGSIVLIGNEPTALLRLLEKIEENNDADKNPALIIATPVGFCGATPAKDYLWERHQKLEIPCITFLGTGGGGMMAATIMNTLLDIKQGKLY